MERLGVSAEPDRHRLSRIDASFPGCLRGNGFVHEPIVPCHVRPPHIALRDKLLAPQILPAYVDQPLGLARRTGQRCVAELFELFLGTDIQACQMPGQPGPNTYRTLWEHFVESPEPEFAKFERVHLVTSVFKRATQLKYSRIVEQIAQVVNR